MVLEHRQSIRRCIQLIRSVSVQDRVDTVPFLARSIEIASRWVATPPLDGTLRATTMGDISLILSDIERGDEKAVEELLRLVQHELRAMAAKQMANEKPGHTLQ